MNSFEPIGGFIGWELPKAGKSYHEGLLEVNTGRNGLEFILKYRSYRKIYVPYYTCEAVLEPLKRLDMRVYFYHIDQYLNPVLPKEVSVTEDSCILVTNYFGIKNLAIKNVLKTHKRIIVDNCQAFFARPSAGADFFFSPRKFYGVPDGGYVALDGVDTQSLDPLLPNRNYSIDHLIGRLVDGPEDSYTAYLENEKAMDNQTISGMSLLTQRILKSTGKGAAAVRRSNYFYLDSYLKDLNELTIGPLGDGEVPLIYPFLNKRGDLRSMLQKRRIYIATYWQSVIDSTEPTSFEHYLAENLLPLPIDQRYSNEDLDRLIECILNG